MKLKEFQEITPDRLETAEEILKTFNSVILNTNKGKLFYAQKVIEQFKWLFVMPLVSLEQLIAGLEIMPYANESEKKAKEEIMAILHASIPVKKLLDEQWADLEISI